MSLFVNIRLSEKGREFIIDFLPAHVENVKKIGSGLQKDDVAQIFGSLKKIIEGFGRFTPSLTGKSSTASGGRNGRWRKIDQAGK